MPVQGWRACYGTGTTTNRECPVATLAAPAHCQWRVAGVEREREATCSPRRERQCRRAAEQCDELAALHHSITSSARASSVVRHVEVESGFGATRQSHGEHRALARLARHGDVAAHHARRSSLSLWLMCISCISSNCSKSVLAREAS